ncbi:unnamed protein product [Acanthoscelides obtectus]|uniref:Uncharacterized protein n=1 Tax=Acanthoscelides obtectus TaxID=200917 RepID=A0A9P0MKQ0_ACAOB|nr:unnamed protein product [Acanthoscelides obtectus]CAK1646068.1 hypothetical protein AOBTE_LOCUS14433 [Acanthoscelides obtectus]
MIHSSGSRLSAFQCRVPVIISPSRYKLGVAAYNGVTAGVARAVVGVVVRRIPQRHGVAARTPPSAQPLCNLLAACCVPPWATVRRTQR